MATRHFRWRRPQPASEYDFARYLFDRAVTSQGIVSIDSICYGNVPFKAAVTNLLEELVDNGDLVTAQLEGASKVKHWVPADLMEEGPPALDESRVQILSPFDPLMIQRRRTKLFFDYEHSSRPTCPLPSASWATSPSPS